MNENRIRSEGEVVGVERGSVRIRVGKPGHQHSASTMTRADLLEGGPLPLADEIRTMIDKVRPERARVDPARVIGIGELAAVLGVSTMTIRRWSDEGRIPKPERAPGSGGPGWRRWPIAVAIQIVKDAGAKVPEIWEKT